MRTIATLWIYIRIPRKLPYILLEHTQFIGSIIDTAVNIKETRRTYGRREDLS